MKWLMMLAVVLPLSVSAATILECKPAEGKFDVRDLVVGDIVFNDDEVILFQQVPVFETVTFDAKKAEHESSRTGSWTTYSYERIEDQIITLQIEDSGKTRRAYLTRENVPFADEVFLDIIRMKCTER